MPNAASEIVGPCSKLGTRLQSDQWDQRIGFLDNIYFVLYMGGCCWLHYSNVNLVSNSHHRVLWASRGRCWARPGRVRVSWARPGRVDVRPSWARPGANLGLAKLRVFHCASRPDIY